MFPGSEFSDIFHLYVDFEFVVCSSFIGWLFPAVKLEFLICFVYVLQFSDWLVFEAAEAPVVRRRFCIMWFVLFCSTTSSIEIKLFGNI